MNQNDNYSSVLDSEALILVMTEHMALQRCSSNAIKACKKYAQVFLQAMSDYTSLKKIPVSELKDLSIVYDQYDRLCDNIRKLNINGIVYHRQFRKVKIVNKKYKHDKLK